MLGGMGGIAPPGGGTIFGGLGGIPPIGGIIPGLGGPIICGGIGIPGIPGGGIPGLIPIGGGIATPPGTAPGNFPA